MSFNQPWQIIPTIPTFVPNFPACSTSLGRLYSAEASGEPAPYRANLKLTMRKKWQSKFEEPSAGKPSSDWASQARQVLAKP